MINILNYKAGHDTMQPQLFWRIARRKSFVSLNL